MHGSLCVCALTPRLETRTRVVLVIHRFEDRKPTNTGRLATLCLTNSEVVVRGTPAEPSAPLALPPGSRPLLLFPDPDARPLHELANSNDTFTLIVPDGNWRQASKVRKRVPGMSDVPCVSLPPGPASIYRLRTETREEGLSTLEAIARALGVLEGTQTQEALERIFRTIVERTLWARGLLDARDLEAGVPDGVKRHDPTSGVARGIS